LVRVLGEQSTTPTTTPTPTGSPSGFEFEGVQPPMVPIASGTFLMGAALGKYPEDGESPIELVNATEVTVAQFR
jgi:formylglycine-generating enzyme required for sulfatase activity